MNVLIIGASGFVGEKLFNVLSERFNVTGTYNTKSKDKLVKLDMGNSYAVSELIAQTKANIVIHTAGITNVDLFEKENEKYQKISSEWMANVINGCRRTGSKPIYISTDYVFDGKKGDYKEDDETNPINAYGRSKLNDEKALESSGLDYLILRISVPYGYNSADDKQTFEKWVMNNLKDGKEISVIDDQINTPTFIDDIAQVVERMIEMNESGIFHVAGSERISRYDFALSVAETFNLNKNLIKRAKAKDLKWNAQRPLDSSLNIDKLKSLGIEMSNVKKGLVKMRKQIE